MHVAKSKKGNPPISCDLFCFLKDVKTRIGTFRAKSEILPVEMADVLDALDVFFRHVANHFPARHFDVDAFFLAVHVKKTDVDERFVGADAFGVFLAG